MSLYIATKVDKDRQALMKEFLISRKALEITDSWPVSDKG